MHIGTKLHRRGLTIGENLIIIIKSFGVWRSLVSRMVRVHEAAGSNPATPTKENSIANGCFAVLFLYL